jgi:predicted nucleotidyltransferase
MDVSLPIASVISTLDGPVLAVLAATSAPVGVSEIARRAGRGTPQGVGKAVRGLVRAGLVLEVPGGYLLNRDHLAAPAIEQLSSLNGELLSRIRNRAVHFSGEIELLGLFGSAARRDGDEESDIDLLFVSDDPLAEDFAFELALDIRKWTGNEVQMIVRSSQELRKLEEVKEPIIENWRREMIVIAGDRSILEMV